MDFKSFVRTIELRKSVKEIVNDNYLIFEVEERDLKDVLDQAFTELRSHLSSITYKDSVEFKEIFYNFLYRKHPFSVKVRIRDNRIGSVKGTIPVADILEKELEKKGVKIIG